MQVGIREICVNLEIWLDLVSVRNYSLVEMIEVGENVDENKF